MALDGSQEVDRRLKADASFVNEEHFFLSFSLFQ